MKRTFWILLAICTVSTSSAYGQIKVSCPLGDNEKLIVQEAIVRNTQEAKWVINQTHGGTFQDRGFAKNLIGNSSNQLSVVTLIEQCTAPRQFTPFCEPVCDANANCSHYQRCSQLGCESAGVDTIKAWWQPAPVIYKTDQPIIPNFNIRYPTKPTVNFRYDARKQGVIDITWHAEDKVHADAGQQDLINASSNLKVTGRSSEAGPVNASVDIMFPFMPGHKLSTHIQFAIDENASTTGEIHVGGKIVGKIIPGDEEQDPRINWSPECL